MYDFHGIRHDTFYASWRPASTPDGPALAVVACWPRIAADLVEVRHGASDEWLPLDGTAGIAAFPHAAAGEALELRCFPAASVVVFELPPLVDLPDIDDLFAARIDRFHAEDLFNLKAELCFLTGAPFASLDFLTLPEAAFPFERRALTVDELVDELELLLGRSIGFSGEGHSFTDGNPSRAQRAWVRTRSFVERHWP